MEKVSSGDSQTHAVKGSSSAPAIETVTPWPNSSPNYNTPIHHGDDDLEALPSYDKNPPKYRQWEFFIVIGSLFLGTFLLALDTTIIGTAIPSITTSFHTLDDIAWYGSGYLLTLTALQPSFGKLYKLLNIKAIYLTCVAIFEGRYEIPKSCTTAVKKLNCVSWVYTLCISPIVIRLHSRSCNRSLWCSRASPRRSGNNHPFGST
jgi:hypothetical protein